ncbi:MAG: tRNA 2-thiouridine(34) synthase MnmA [Deltaproteobacteria bacterium]|jgi:tRNA-specific 2-thiouridylase|nr:tRNA 2-thiouridine(34) synthase MnmA [Deltaproteobacteria bacterium]
MARVLLAMSGGVDSSTAGYLLKESGHEVTGAFMSLLDGEIDSEGQRACCSAKDIEDARQAAAKLDFDFLVFNFRQTFFREVIARFAKAYAQGLTPNPCLDCNRYLKFGRFRQRAKILGHECVATGHYARIEYDRDRGRYLLKKALDPAKDQSYALYALAQAELAQTFFPLGAIPKSEIRRLAASLGLSSAEKPDSQDICFVRSGHYTDFLAGLGISSPPGDIVDVSGRKLGRHQGLHRYTIGQRRGLGLCRPEPWYVVELDPERNAVVVGGEKELRRERALVKNVNFIAIDRLVAPLEVMAKIRYRQEEIPAEISPWPLGALLTFKKPQKGVSPGQAAVFYQGDAVVGGGTIARDKI